MKKSKAKALPKAVRNTVWTKYIGENFVGKCYVCSSKITILAYECGHVTARAKGGSDTVDNLRPICSNCNKSMQTMNLEEYKKKYHSNGSYCTII